MKYLNILMLAILSVACEKDIFTKDKIKKNSTSCSITTQDFNNPIIDTNNEVYTKLLPNNIWYKENNTNISQGKLTLGKVKYSFPVNPDAIYRIAYDYTEGGSLFIMHYSSDSTFLGYTTPSKNNGVSITNVYTNTFNSQFIQLYVYTNSLGYVDNICVGRVIELDTDGDGVPDRLDDYPVDSLRAYKRVYKNLMCFEDTWPGRGDLDFNDLVSDNIIEYRLNKNFEYVDALVNCKILALGAGASSGLSLRFLNGGSDIIQSVTDADNSVNIANDVRRDLSPRYYNTNINGLNTTNYHQYNKVVTFKSNVTGNLYGEFYIYRTNERGRETHMPYYSGTNLVDSSRFYTSADYNGTYKTRDGLPWAFEINEINKPYFKWCLEKVDIRNAYSKFADWSNSDGTRYIGWMLVGNSNLTYHE
jgi:LruC domain-containing protein